VGTETHRRSLSLLSNVGRGGLLRWLSESGDGLGLLSHQPRDRARNLAVGGRPMVVQHHRRQRGVVRSIVRNARLFWAAVICIVGVDRKSYCLQPKSVRSDRLVGHTQRPGSNGL